MNQQESSMRSVVEDEGLESPDQILAEDLKASIDELRRDLGLSRVELKITQDPQRANVIDELAVEAQSGIYLLSPERSEPATRQMEVTLKALEDQATQQAEIRRSNYSDILGASMEGKKSIPRRLRAREKWQPLTTSPEVKDHRRRLYEQTLQECGLHLEDDGNGGEKICVTRSPPKKLTRRKQLEGLERLVNPPSKYLPKSRSYQGFVGRMQESLSHGRSAPSVGHGGAADEGQPCSTEADNGELWPSQPLKAGQLGGKRHTRPSSAATASTEAPTLADDISEIYSLPSRPGSAPRSRPQSAGRRPPLARPFSAGPRPMPESERSSMMASNQRQRPFSAQGALNVPSSTSQGKEETKATDARWLLPPGAIEGCSVAPWSGRVLFLLGSINKERSEQDDTEVKPPSPSVCSTDSSELSGSPAQIVEDALSPSPGEKDDKMESKEMSLRQALQAAQAGKASVHVTKQIASTAYHVEAAELSPRARAEILAAALSGRVPVRDKTAVSSKAGTRGSKSTSESNGVNEGMGRASASKSSAGASAGTAKASTTSHAGLRNGVGRPGASRRNQAESEATTTSSSNVPPSLTKSMPTLPTPKKDHDQVGRAGDWNRKQAEKPFQDFRDARNEIRSHEGSVGWQLRNGKTCSIPIKKTAAAAASSSATWKPPNPGEKLWSAGKVWKTAPRTYNLERQKHELLKIYQTSSALLQECEVVMAGAP